MATIQGVYITVLGMVILFAALLILMLAAMGLERLFRSKELEEVLVRPEENAPSVKEKESVAAIAVAIALNRKPQIANRKSQIPERSPSAWKLWGRYRQLMRSREVKGHREQ